MSRRGKSFWQKINRINQHNQARRGYYSVEDEESGALQESNVENTSPTSQPTTSKRAKVAATTESAHSTSQVPPNEPEEVQETVATHSGGASGGAIESAEPVIRSIHDGLTYHTFRHRQIWTISSMEQGTWEYQASTATVRGIQSIWSDFHMIPDMNIGFYLNSNDITRLGTARTVKIESAPI